MYLPSDATRWSKTMEIGGVIVGPKREVLPLQTKAGRGERGAG